MQDTTHFMILQKVYKYGKSHPHSLYSIYTINIIGVASDIKKIK